MNYRIRRIEEADIPALLDLCREHAAFEHADYTENGHASRLEQALFGANPLLECLVVESAGQLVGYASFMLQYATWDAAHYLHLDCLYLQAAVRGQGIGKALMVEMRAIARERGCIRLEWQTPVFNVEAIGFYEALGAVAKAKQRFFWSVKEV